jgi:hypothetical protein
MIEIKIGEQKFIEGQDFAESEIYLGIHYKVSHQLFIPSSLILKLKTWLPLFITYSDDRAEHSFTANYADYIYDRYILSEHHSSVISALSKIDQVIGLEEFCKKYTS